MDNYSSPHGPAWLPAGLAPERSATSAPPTLAAAPVGSGPVSSATSAQVLTPPVAFHQTSAPIVAVIGAVGGSWASTFASTCAALLADEKGDAWLAETGALGNLETLLGLEDSQGLRWSDLSDTSGEVDTRALYPMCPQYAGFAAITHSARATGPSKQLAMDSVFHSLRAHARSAVLDASANDLTWLTAHASHVVLVTPLTLQGLSSTLRARKFVEKHGIPAAVVTTEARQPELTVKQLERALGAKVCAHLPNIPTVRAAVLHGLGPLGGPARPTRRLHTAAAQAFEGLGIRAS